MSHHHQNAGYPQYGGQQQYGAPQQPQYGAPQQPQYGAPQQQFGAPHQQPYGAPQQQQYGAPQQQPYGAPQQQYGAPAQQPYGAPAQQPYGAPAQQPYGAPAQHGAPPAQQYGAGGYSSSYAAPQQQGYGAPAQHVIVGPQYVVQGQPLVLILAEKKISMGTDSTVTNQSGQVLFKFDGKALSLKDKRLLYDANGQLLVTMTQKMFSKHHTWLVSRGAGGQELCTIQQDDAGSYGGANVYLGGKPRFGVSTADYVIRVQAGGKDFQVQTKTGQLLAETSRSNQFLGSMMGADRYGLVVQPGVDMAFIVCICTAMDDMTFA